MAIYKWFPVRVTGVTLDKSSLIMLNAGDTQQLTATVSPANAENKSVVWSTSDATVATVDQTGLVTCVTPGTCDITVTTVDGGHTAICGVTNSGWTPSIHTLLYCPLDSVNGVSDITGNHTMTTHSSSYGNAPAIDSTGFYKFDGGYIASEAYTGPKQGTISIWLNRSTKHTGAGEAWGYSTHFGVGQPPYHTFALNFGSQRGGTWALVYSNSYLGIYPSLPNIGEWTQWTFTYSDSDGAKMYVDGQLYATDSSIGDIYQWSKPTTIGGNGDNQFFEGYLADVIYEDKVWSAGEVGVWYEQSMPRYKREPTSNTVLYCPLETDIDNDSSSGLVTTGYGNYSFTTQGGVPCVYSNSGVLYNNDMGLGDNRTISCWFYPTFSSGNWQIFWDLSDTTSQAWARGCSLVTNPSHYLGVYEHLYVGADNITSELLTSSWHNIIMSYDDTGYTIYLDGQNVGTGNIDIGYNNGDRFNLGYRDGAGSYQFIDGYMSNLIVESRTWSANDVSVYYNQTKGDYGIS